MLGAHTAPISSIVYHSSSNTVYTGSWDQTVRAWDPRTPRTNPLAYVQPERVYAMDAVGNYLVVAMAGRLLNIYDLRMVSAAAQQNQTVEPAQRRDSSLRFMTKTLTCMADGTGRLRDFGRDCPNSLKISVTSCRFCDDLGRRARGGGIL